MQTRYRILRNLTVWGRVISLCFNCPATTCFIFPVSLSALLYLYQQDILVRGNPNQRTCLISSIRVTVSCTFEGFFFVLDLVNLITIDLCPGKPRGNFIMLLLVAEKVHFFSPSQTTEWETLVRTGTLTSFNNIQTKRGYAKMICNRRENLFVY
jgi:hypothetical protein